MNAARLNRTNERMCIPPMDEDLFVDAVKAIVKVDADWIPSAPGTALYIRPYIISDEGVLLRGAGQALPLHHYSVRRGRVLRHQPGRPHRQPHLCGG